MTSPFSGDIDTGGSIEYQYGNKTIFITNKEDELAKLGFKASQGVFAPQAILGSTFLGEVFNLGAGRDTLVVISQGKNLQAIYAGHTDDQNTISIDAVRYPPEKNFTGLNQRRLLYLEDNGHITDEHAKGIYTEIAKAEAVASIGKTGDGTTVPNRTVNNNTMAGNGR